MALQRFCPKCGKRGIKGDFCSDCAPDILADFDINNSMTVCASCGKYQGATWIRSKSLSDAIYGYIKNQFKKRGTIGVDTHIPKHTQNEGVNVEFDVDVTIGIEKYNVPFEIGYTLCPNCQKKGTQYFEGVLQVRNPTDKAMTLIRRLVKKENGKGVYINDEQKVRGGIDLYITSKRFLRKIPGLIQAQFGGEVDISQKIFSRDKQKSKDIYRVNALIKLPDFSWGEVIKVKNTLYLVLGHGKRISVFDLMLGKKKTLEYKGLEYEKMVVYTTQVTKVNPSLEVLHPLTFQSVAVRNRPQIQYKVNKKVRVVIDDDVFIL